MRGERERLTENERGVFVCNIIIVLGRRDGDRGERETYRE